MRIVFMGTPDYSVKTLEALFNSEHELCAVFAQPDKPVGRKQILTPPPTKTFALEHGIPIFQPASLKNGEALEILKQINPDVIVVVAYGKILPADILKLPRFGCINGHASLLPRHRGASPIQWSIVCGDKVTGVTTMLMDEGMDTGDILQVAKTDIGENETAEELFDRLSIISAELMLKTLDGVQNATITPIKQNNAEATYAPIIKKEMAHIDFSKSAAEICNLVRGFYSWPCAFFLMQGKRIKVIKAAPYNAKSDAFGRVIENDGRLVVSCGENTAVELLEIQPEGSKPMSASQMLCGHKIPIGTVVE